MQFICNIMFLVFFTFSFNFDLKKKSKNLNGEE